MQQCVAKSKRSGGQCKRLASKGKEVCRCHGGRSTGPKTKAGKERTRLSVLKSGLYTKEAKTERLAVRSLIQECRQAMRSIST